MKGKVICALSDIVFGLLIGLRITLLLGDTLVKRTCGRHAFAMEIRVLYFAAARELAGCGEEAVSVAAGASAAGLFAHLAERHPRLAPYGARIRLAVNGELVEPERALADGDEVALIPPVAGGAGVPARLLDLRATPLSVDEAIAAVTHPGAGGIAVFLGVVRDNADGKPVARLEYEAYADLARKEMARILDAIELARPGVRLAAVHRVGALAIGDAAVVIAASAPHRQEAFTACREAIDRIKETVPVWKKEWAPDGSAIWVNLEPPA